MKRILAVIAATVWVAVAKLPDDKVHVVFCDVGQGDAILISYQTTQLVIDGGPDEKIINCLARHMPFYDKRIEVGLLTHPESDHLTGWNYIAERYTVRQFVMDKIMNKTGEFDQWMKEVQDKKISLTDGYMDGKIEWPVKDKRLTYRIVWPEKLAISDTDTEIIKLNSRSISGILEYGDFRVMLPGDAGTDVEEAELKSNRLKPVTVLKVPHHGSKTGLNQEWLEKLEPKLAVISVGKNNKFGHPAQEILKMLTDAGIKTARTDQKGDIEIISDGKRWWLR